MAVATSVAALLSLSVRISAFTCLSSCSARLTEPLGDYFAGPNHILPTNGTARFFSPVNVDDFIKKTSIISYSRQALEKVHNQIETFAKSEGLTAHANSIKVRFED